MTHVYIGQLIGRVELSVVRDHSGNPQLKPDEILALENQTQEAILRALRNATQTLDKEG